MAAGERKIFRFRLSAVLPGNDVIEMKWKLAEWFGEMTVFAAMLCPIANGSSEEPCSLAIRRRPGKDGLWL
jgi:hypothetical protein